jgi:hypothetical protein
MLVLRAFSSMIRRHTPSRRSASRSSNRPANEDLLQAWPVSKRVNRPGNDEDGSLVHAIEVTSFLRAPRPRRRSQDLAGLAVAVDHHAGHEDRPWRRPVTRRSEPCPGSSPPAVDRGRGGAPSQRGVAPRLSRPCLLSGEASGQ